MGDAGLRILHAGEDIVEGTADGGDEVGVGEGSFDDGATT